MDTETFEYLAAMMPDARIACDGCGVEFNVTRQVARDGRHFCSASCADRSCAVCVKPTLASAKRIDGWDV